MGGPEERARTPSTTEGLSGSITESRHAAGSFITVDSSNWLAQLFSTDSSAASFSVTSVSLALGNAANTSGNFFVSINNNTGSNLPGTTVGTLSGTANPSTAGTYTFTSAGISLNANTKYWIRVGVSSGSGSYSWLDTQSFEGFNHTGTWSLFNDFANGIPTDSYSFNGGSSWNKAYGTPYKFELSAVPEPTTIGLVAAGLAASAFGLMRRRK